jgi:hypothetical protein
MTATPAQFPFVQRDPAAGAASLTPLLPITLRSTGTAQVVALADTGAALNVLPYAVGVQLGFDWDSQSIPVRLTGNLGAVEARVVVAEATVGPFAPVRLAFAWAKSDVVPVLLGQVNFFMEFEVCFFRARGVFEVRRNP